MGAIPVHRAQCRLYWVPLSPKKFNIRQIFENLFLEIVRDFFRKFSGFVVDTGQGSPQNDLKIWSRPPNLGGEGQIF